MIILYITGRIITINIEVNIKTYAERGVTMSRFNVAVCQMKVTDSKKENLEKARKMIKEAAYKENVKIVVLPEMFNCPYDTQVMREYAEENEGETEELLSSLAKELGIYIIGGSIPEKCNEKIYNTSFVFDSNGKNIAKHRKIHLFDVDIEGGVKFKESDVLSSGEEVTIVETEFCKLGVAICYDMRFPELMRMMALKGAEVIIVPAAFNMTTGPAHWNTLIKIRALDNQVYFVAASPARNIEANYLAYGHSSIVNPWGDIIEQCDEREGIICGEIDLEFIKKIREELPLLKHRQEKVYCKAKE